MSDAYAWSVQYRDGSTYRQINDAGQDVGRWADALVGDVAIIRLEPQRDGLPLHGVLVPDGARAFLTFRRGIELNPSTGEQIKHPAVMIAGWESPDGGAAYLFVDELGNALIANTRDAI